MLPTVYGVPLFRASETPRHARTVTYVGMSYRLLRPCGPVDKLGGSPGFCKGLPWADRCPPFHLNSGSDRSRRLCSCIRLLARHTDPSGQRFLDLTVATVLPGWEGERGSETEEAPKEYHRHLGAPLLRRGFAHPLAPRRSVRGSELVQCNHAPIPSPPYFPSADLRCSPHPSFAAVYPVEGPKPLANALKAIYAVPSAAAAAAELYRFKAAP